MLSRLHISSVGLLDIFLDQTCVGCQILPLLFHYVTLSLYRNNNTQYIWVVAISIGIFLALYFRSLCWFDGNFLSLQCDLLNMPAVAQLEKDEKYQLLYELLKIFLTKRLDSYLEFQTANSALLKDYGMFSCWTSTNDSSLRNSSMSYILAAFLWFFYEQSTGLVHEDCITKMRLMSLLDLSSHCSGEVPYSAITSALQVNWLFYLLFIWSHDLFTFLKL